MAYQNAAGKKPTRHTYAKILQGLSTIYPSIDHCLNYLII